MASTAQQGPTRGEHSLGIDVGTTGGEWLFKVDGMLFGPVPARVLVDKLYKGEVVGDTPIAPEGGEFKRLREIPFFVVHVAKAEAKLRVDGEKQQVEAVERRRGKLRIGIIVAGIVVALLGGTALVSYAIKNKLYMEQHEELADIAISFNADDIQLAVAAALPVGDTAEEEVEYVEGEKPGEKKPVRAGRGGGGKDAPGGPGGAASATKKPFDEENITESKYDQGTINKVVKNSQANLHSCLKEQALSDPSFRGDVPLTFTVNNDGKAGKLWIDKSGYKTGPFYDCMKAKLAEWKFPSFEGERPTVSLSFKVGK